MGNKNEKQVDFLSYTNDSSANNSNSSINNVSRENKSSKVKSPSKGLFNRNKTNSDEKAAEYEIKFSYGYLCSFQGLTRIAIIVIIQKFEI